MTVFTKVNILVYFQFAFKKRTNDYRLAAAEKLFQKKNGAVETDAANKQ